MSDEISTQDPSTPTKKGSATSPSALVGLSPLGLMDGVLGGRSSDWEPPAPESLESSFPGYSDFQFLDRGGMGAVYSATQASLNRRVAVKILPPELLDDEGFMERFRQEATMLARLQHPHIVAVHDSGATQEGHHYIVMEYVEGSSLQEILRREKITTARALTITAQVCEALHYAHERGVIHRDIKPSNILIDERGLVRVADFGLAKSSRETEKGSTSSPHTKVFMGTIGYSAPELHVRGSVADRRSDIFSLGVTLYEMLTGRLPAGVFDPPSKLVGTPGHVDKIITRALMQQPEGRYETAQKMRDAIAASLLRMGTPLVQRAIISKPITSMVTCVIVGMGLIYLIDALNNQLILKPKARARAAMSMPAITPDFEESDLVLLSHDWALLGQRVRWGEVQTILANKPEWQFAEIHHEEELKEVVNLLKQQSYNVPVWLAAEAPQDDGSPYSWLSGKPMDYQPWISRTSEPLMVTEIQAKNGSTLIVGEESPDWIEVTNTSSTPVDLMGYQLRHYIADGSRRFMSQEWLEAPRLPSGQPSILQPGERRVILCSSRPVKSEYISFRISLEATAGGIHWCDPNGHIVQRFDTPWRAFPEDTSIVLAPDGKNWGWTSKPTPGAANSPIEDSFPAPTEGSPDKMGLMLHPGFSGRWCGNPQRYPKPALLRRKKQD